MAIASLKAVMLAEGNGEFTEVPLDYRGFDVEDSSARDGGVQIPGPVTLAIGSPVAPFRVPRQGLNIYSRGSSDSDHHRFSIQS